MSDRRSMFDVVHKYFANSPWHVTQFSGKPILRFSHQGANGHWVCVAHARESEARFVFYSIGVMDVPAERRSTLAEFLTRANFGMIIGNFEMDLDDGEVRFKTSIDVEGDRLRASQLRELVATNLAMMDKYLPGVLGVVEGTTDPGSAIVEIEGPVAPIFEE